MQNAVIYARYSSHGQNEQTIEGQIRVCSEYAQQHKLRVVNIYIDKHKTGTDVNRPQFQKMIDDAATGAFTHVIVYMIDRFARNRYYSTVYRWQLQQQNIRVVSATENISESEEGEFYQMFLEWNAEKYSTRLSKRVREGLTTSVANGTFAGGYLIYGYKKEGKRVVINEEEASIVRYFFEEYASGVPKKDIAEALNARGERYHGKPWRGRDFDKMLTNAKYTGTFEFGGRLCANTYPQIIYKALFDKVQRRAQQNKYFSGANSARITYLLQGKLYCGHCGANMVADGGTSKTGAVYHYYACSAKKKRRTCTKRNEKKDFLEWYATEQTVAYLSDPRRVALIADDVIAYYESRTDTSEIKRITDERTRIQKEIDNAVNLMVSGVSPEVVKTLDKKIVELTAQLNDLTEYQAKLELERGLQVRREDIIAFVAEFIRGDLHDKDFQKRIIDNLVNAMYIYDDRVVLYFNISGGRETAFIGKEDTDEASGVPLDDNNNAHAGAGGGVQTLTPSLRQERQCLNTPTIRYIFVRGVAGIVITREKGNR